MVDGDYILEMENISKSFPGVRALDQVRLYVRRGTVHALMGENGAGKSTLMKILIGMLQKDAGTIRYNGEPFEIGGIHEALNKGISMIFQELHPILDMTVAENIFIGRETKTALFVDRKKMMADTQALLDRLGVDYIRPGDKVRTLSAAKMQMVEICKALSYGARLIIMDEPTSALTEDECGKLFDIVRELKKEGTAFIFISHKMDEIFRISDEVTVMRDGKFIETRPASEMNTDDLIRLMVGREIKNVFPKQNAEIGEEVLRVENLSSEGAFENVSFDIRRGEIFGLAGLMGAGRTEIAEAIFGFRKITSGKIYLRGQRVKIRTPREAIRNKMAFLTEDRKYTGLFLPLSVSDNIIMPSLQKFLRMGLLRGRQVNESSVEAIERFAIKTPSTRQTVENLSGGNQQKVLVARWMLTVPDIIILDEPTRGIDVGAKAEIHKIMSSLACQGKTVLMISSEMPELIGMCDRIGVMDKGRLSGILEGNQINQVNIMRYAAGLAL